MLPKAARMESFDDDRTDSSAASNTVPHIIVACPKCSTKFAVESSVVAAVEDPKFHCSRCDEVFSLEEVSTVLHRDLVDSETPSNNRESVGEEPPHTVLQAFNPQPSSSSPPTEKQTTPPHTSGPTSNSAISASSMSASSIPAPIRASDFSVASNFPRTEPPVTESVSSSQTGWVILPEAQPSSGPPSPHSAVKPNLVTAPAPELKAPVPPAPHYTGSPTSQGVQQEFGFDRAAAVTQLSRMQSLALAAAPLLIVLALLFIASYSIRLSPETLGAAVTKVTSSFGGVSPLLPPPQLTVSKVSFKSARIASKEVVPVVTGIIINRSQMVVDGVTLEALGFDSRGELLLSAQAPLRSALGREKLSELSLDMLKKFQSSLGARSAKINPGEEVPFTIALIPDGSRDDQPSLADIDLSQLKFFSARVFAVTSLSAK